MQHCAAFQGCWYDLCRHTDHFNRWNLLHKTTFKPVSLKPPPRFCICIAGYITIHSLNTVVENSLCPMSKTWALLLSLSGMWRWLHGSECRFCHYWGLSLKVKPITLPAPGNMMVKWVITGKRFEESIRKKYQFVAGVIWQWEKQHMAGLLSRLL